MRAEVIRLLFTDGGQELYTREVARLSFLALRTVQDELAKLESANLIVSRTNGYSGSIAQIRNPPSTAPWWRSFAKAPHTRSLIPELSRADELCVGSQRAHNLRRSVSREK